jgi:hypothetical protein
MRAHAHLVSAAVAGCCWIACCRVPLPSLQDLLIPPGQTLAELTAKDATQVEQLMAAAAAARADAVAAISGQPAAAPRRSVGKPQGVSVSGGGEIEPTEDSPAAAGVAPKRGSLAGRHCEICAQSVYVNVWVFCSLERVKARHRQLEDPHRGSVLCSALASAPHKFLTTASR